MLERLRIGVAHTGAGMAPVFAALDGGYLAAQGFAPELVPTGGHPNALRALLDREVDVVNSVGPELLLANHRLGGDAVCIASAIGRTAVQLAARPGIAGRDALRGKRWGVLSRGDPDECAMLVALDAWGWDTAHDAVVVEVGGTGARLDRLLDPARVDVAVMHAPEPFQAIRRGWTIVDDLGRLDSPFQNSCAATTRRMLQAKPDTALRYVRAYCAGLWRFRTDAAFGLELLHRHTGEPDRAILGQSWAMFARLMGGMMFPSVEGMRRAGAVLARLGALPEPVAPEAAIDLGPVAALEREGFFLSLMGVPPAWRP